MRMGWRESVNRCTLYNLSYQNLCRHEWKIGKKKICFGSSVTWELVYFILSFATAVHSFLVNEMEESILPFKLLHAVFWLREEFAEVIKKDQGNAALGHSLFCSVSQQSEMIYKWSDGGVESTVPSQVAAVFLSARGKGKALRNEVHMAAGHTSWRLSGWRQWNQPSHSQKVKRGQANYREEERESRKSLNISVTFSRFAVKAWRYIVCEGRQVYDIVC